MMKIFYIFYRPHNFSKKVASLPFLTLSVSIAPGLYGELIDRIRKQTDTVKVGLNDNVLYTEDFH